MILDQNHSAGRLRAATLWLLAAAASVDALAEPVADQVQEQAIEEILVTGTQPGPGLWRVSNPSAGDGHVLWILGTYGPLPKKMQWQSDELEIVLAESQECIGPPRMNAAVGPIRGLALLPSLVGIRRNPDGARLQDVVPADLYARWTPLKQRYIGRDDDVEKWRPIFAAQEVFSKALKQSGLESSVEIWPVVEKLARKHKVPVTEPEISVEFDEPRSIVREFKKTPLDDVECFARTITRLESDLDLMKVRANAWATGDVARLRELAPVDNASACIAAILDAQFMLDLGADEWPELRATAWLEAAQTALGRNPSTVAVLSVDQILKPDGYVARLRSRGYLVEDP
jgi:hypothetical protein